MKSFLVKNKRPTVRWGSLPDNTFFKGKVPEGYKLAICPSEGYIVIDVDRHGVDGFSNLDPILMEELRNTLNYKTDNNGAHYWFKYTGSKDLPNKSSSLGIDLRVGGKGYVVWYTYGDIMGRIDEIKESSDELNEWIENTFSYK